jgi:flagellar hook-basal body complex protein FliE
MNIQGIGIVNELGKFGGIQPGTSVIEDRNTAFETLFDAATNMIKETNQFTNEAEEAEMAFSLGLLDNTHDLQVAQQKANLALQFTIAVRNQVLDAYKEIMNLQF